jgi:hypothetical protein
MNSGARPDLGDPADHGDAAHPTVDEHHAGGHAGTPPEESPDSIGVDALTAMRRTRRRHRLGELEWFEALYRVYLAAFLGGGAFFFVAGLVDDSRVGTDTAADIYRLGPGWLGLAAVVAVGFGLRSGSRGGPLSVEEADVRHVLLAPIDRRRALNRPAQQRLRSVGFALAVVGAAAGQLASRRLEGSAGWWVIAGAAFGAACAALFIGTALVSHGLRLPRWTATVVAAAIVGWQIGAIAAGVAGPGDGLGHLAILPLGGASSAAKAGVVASVAVAIVVAVAGWLLVGHQRLEALARRSALVAQLRFAVTMQDLRTVVLLRRQLSQEYLRARPWFGTTADRDVRAASPRRMPIWWRRGWRGLARFPLTRVARILVLTAGAAACQVAAFRGTSPAIAGSGILAFIIGLELIEPLSQEVDQADRCDALPIDRGVLYIRLLVVPAVAALAVIAIGAAVAYAFEPDAGTVLIAPMLALGVLTTGLGGAAINAVSGAPDPLATSAGQVFMPPEVAGTTTMIKAVWPLAISVVGSLPVLGVRSAIRGGEPATAAVLRGTIGVLLLGALVGCWVRYRDELRLWWRNFVQEGKAAQSRS